MTDPTAVHQGFASDNHAGVHPDVLAALTAAAPGRAAAYGADPWTERLGAVVRRHFGDTARAYPVFNGTGANVVGLQAMADPWSAAICTATSHVHVDECGAAERVAGLKLLPVAAPDGKLTPELVDPLVTGFGDPHHAQPRVITITQATELGTVYTPAEVAALAEYAHGRGLLLHMDGARLANAAASLGVPARAFTADAGVDVLSLGGTKNGAMLGEAVVVLDPGAVRGIEYVRKMDLQLASKMRFVSAQLVALFDGDLWLRNARHANAMARRLADAVRSVPGVRITRPVQANGVFAVLPPDAARRLRERYAFHPWDAATGEVRWMCAFDTTPDEVDAFAAAVRAAAAG
ncbi:threonine aldolase family protein [Actinomadura atramentaria]|uniref:threonine aldolase family protein n=1 Tax=Actinomadura atramentaria TaxID=1990 RepID=UPI00037E64E5|nr:beta-eliminating lyase-related protein [Actinomadura atramentaria]